MLSSQQACFPYPPSAWTLVLFLSTDFLTVEGKATFPRCLRPPGHTFGWMSGNTNGFKFPLLLNSMTERWPSGLRRTPGERVGGFTSSRAFKSHSLRQNPPRTPYIFTSSPGILAERVGFEPIGGAGGVSPGID